MRESPAQRLQLIMQERGLKQIDILKMSEPHQQQYGIKLSKSHLSQYVNGKSNPDQDKYFLLAKTLNVSEPWLMGYDVPREIDANPKVSSEIILLERYRNSRPSTQLEMFKAVENIYIRETLYGHSEDGGKSLYKIYIQSTLSAGTGVLDLDPEHVEEVIYKERERVPKHDLAFRVSGDSMRPVFEDGEIVFVEKTQDVHTGQIIAIQINEEAYVKKLYKEENRLRLVSLNNEYEDIFADQSDDIRIIGRVLL